ncbi:hypothetical protein QO209_05240 [Pseudomonas citronellolis]|uniref:hypothetical protein n=1 Tax=Pseudomonas citronellolis TaxID=53408 RepID=UPI002649BC17|nr:hypothetical protein [Pseudomonas citronellolis]MDN6871840.1 hypothetical protein [Pseudomonas citronellolis]
MKQTKYTYGLDVIEFFSFDNDELQEYISNAEQAYYNAIETLDNKLAASVQLKKNPLVVQLPELFKLYGQGYTVRTDRFCNVSGGSLDITLMKPQEMIDADLVQVHKQAGEIYEQQRWIKNSQETERQLNISAEKIKRDKEKARLAAEQKELEAQRERALAELREAYTD